MRLDLWFLLFIVLVFFVIVGTIDVVFLAVGGISSALWALVAVITVHQICVIATVSPPARTDTIEFVWQDQDNFSDRVLAVYFFLLVGSIVLHEDNVLNQIFEHFSFRRDFDSFTQIPPEFVCEPPKQLINKCP